MNIAFFVTQFPTLSETFIVNQIIALQKSGHLVHIYSLHKATAQAVHQNIKDARVPAVTFYFDDLPLTRKGKIISLIGKSVRNLFSKNNHSLFKTFFKNTSSLSVYNFIPFIDKPAYDVLHAHFGVSGNFVTELRKLGIFKQAKFITTFHGYDLIVEPGFYKELFKACNVFTVNSGYTKQKLTALGCQPEKINLLPAGLDTAAFKKKIRQRNNKIINLLFVGRLIPLKGPHLFIEICRRLKQDNLIRFKGIIAGDGEMYNELQAMIINEDLSSYIDMAGDKTQNELIELMDNADIFILPGIIYENRAEAQGLVIQEAQAMELPALISDVGGMREGIIDGETGYVIKESDISSFADKIVFLSNDPELRKRIGSAGRQFVERNYDSKVLNKKLLSIYQEEND